HGGKIDVTSEFNKGAQFIITLPLVNKSTEKHVQVSDSSNL
ncbi:MAG: sensor histidine kinase, partial [Calditrichaeota bacterium]